MSNRIKLLILSIAAITLISIFLFYQTGGNWDYILPRRITKILAIVLTGYSIAVSTVIFQTITNNRILTPSILGLDSLYLLVQTVIIFVLGSMNAAVMNPNINFILSIVFMVLFTSILYKILFKKEGNNNIYFLLLVGLIFGTFFQSISSFMQVLIDPNEFLIVQDKMFASFNNVQVELLVFAGVLVILLSLYLFRFFKYLDVLGLGRDEAVNLGVPYDRVVKQLLIIVAIFISISTALVGPITFLGLLVVNIAYEMFKTYKHSYLLVGSSLISIVVLVGGLLLVERLFTFSTTLSVIINFIGGTYFLYLLLKGSKS
ncbi:iron chelate uptake ABC transporter family permease subunit [Priestia endophytica]|jgi:iron complex transport system permease protein|uniref:Iron ABC transporter permease n=2 Tax=Priestia endophytica TaxID=135735 RepID=A0AAX1Q403_9BACI|nr:iron chelate uptake ABC transporter family permease subunit [Priestia endophytica]KAB2495437.1 iron chelate uptake ABC transporter family permease subunit [Priestia endophytica]KYG27922.1 iron ABC transporter permease [Priestia endophytica]MBG9814059.1 iron ABC transporter permease [Priestia endophytica]MCM3537509.1 iron chelate uptake ABC transporter family permease subunit [Priestia endophytica]RAS73385.1 iron ABC transporter permease [Priestia endophytica]